MAHVKIPGTTVDGKWAYTQPDLGIASGKPSPGAIRGYDPSTYRSMPNIDSIRIATPPIPANKDVQEQTPNYIVVPLDFSAVATNQPVNMVNNFFHFIFATNVGGVNPILLVRIGNINAPQLKLTAGVSIEGMSCEQLFLSWAITGIETGQLWVANRKEDAIIVT